MKIDEIMGVMYHASKLKSVERVGWSRVGIEEKDTDAAHSYGVAMLAMFLAKAEGLSEEKMIKMALVHDLCESITGDSTPYDKDTPEKRKVIKQAEQEAFQKILSGELLDLAEEEHAYETPEARLLKEADMLEMCFQALKFEETLEDKSKLREFWEYAEPKIQSRSGQDILKELKSRSSLF